MTTCVVLKSDDKKAESPSVKKSSKQTELVQKPIHSRHGQDKKDRSQTGSNQEDDDRHGLSPRHHPKKYLILVLLTSMKTRTKYIIKIL